MTEPASSTPPLRILIIDDEANIRLTLSMCLETDGHTVISHGNIQDAMEEISRRVFDLVFLDVRLGMDNGLDFLPTLRAESPWAQVIVITAYASIETAVDAIKKGATDYLPKPFEPAQVQIVTRKVAERRRLELKLEALQSALGATDAESDLPTASPAMREVFELARQVAPSRAPILIRGEIGVGKGRLARAIHAWSKRADAPFAAVACEQSIDSLEADLFGVSPAHTNTHDSLGRIPFCDGGTLLLDEVGHVPHRLQAKLLRLLRDHEYERMDEIKGRPVDVRIIASTSTNLQSAAKSGSFRPDLLMSLDVIDIFIPPLRSRTEDIPLLADRYLALFNRQNHRNVLGITSDALYAMNKYTWPGNVRELRNVIEHTAVLLCSSNRIGIEHLPPNLLNTAPSFAVGDLVPLEVIEKSHVLQVVASTRSLRRAASILGVDSSTLCRWMKRYEKDYEAQNDQPAA